MLAQSCNNNDPGCGANLACTEELIQVTTQVQDMDGNHIELDSTKTFTTEGIEIFKYNSSENGNENILFYPVISDLEIESISRNGSNFTFKGWKSGQEIATGEFLVGKDCCHIEKLDGLDVIVVDQ